MQAIASWKDAGDEATQISADAFLSSFDTPSDSDASEDRYLTRIFCQSMKPLATKRNRWKSALSHISKAKSLEIRTKPRERTLYPPVLPLSEAEQEEAAQAEGVSHADEAAAAGLDPSSPAAKEWLAAKLFAVDSVDTFVPLFKPEKEALANLMPLLKFNPKQTVVAEGDAADGFFFIMRGVVQVSKVVDGASQDITQLSRPACFGELGLIADSGKKRTATITAVGVTELLFLKYSDFQHTLGDRVETIKWGNWIGEAQRRKDAELALGYHKVVSHVSVVYVHG
jgi:CRP-like cAMP-binding protein